MILPFMVSGLISRTVLILNLALRNHFQKKTISDLITEMALEWPSLIGTNPQFWQHEWEKHGTCATKEFKNEREYFTTILSLHDQYDLKAALSAANIGPSNEASISSKSTAAAVKAMFGYSPLLNCEGDSLSEIWICLDKNLRPFDCANLASSPKCPSNIRIPPISGAGPSRYMKLSTGKARFLNFPGNISNVQLLYCFIMLLIAPMILTFVKAAKLYFQGSSESRLQA